MAYVIVQHDSLLNCDRSRLRQKVFKMENQHRKIKGYRELSQPEIDLMNKVKALGEEFCDLIEEIEKHVGNQSHTAEESGGDELSRIILAEPAKWLADGKLDIQVGLMKVVRSVAQPASF